MGDEAQRKVILTPLPSAYSTSAGAGNSVTQGIDSGLPLITQQPENAEPSKTERALFRVKVESKGPVSYQWFFNGAPLPGATSANLVANNVTDQHCGTYFCEITNEVGTIRSQPAFLRLALFDINEIEIQVIPAKSAGRPVTLGVTKPDPEFLKTFQLKWARNGEHISGANATSVEIPPYLQSLGGAFRLLAYRNAKVIFSNIIELRGTHASPKKVEKHPSATETFFDPLAEDEKPEIKQAPMKPVESPVVAQPSTPFFKEDEDPFVSVTPIEMFAQPLVTAPIQEERTRKIMFLESPKELKLEMPSPSPSKSKTAGRGNAPARKFKEINKMANFGFFDPNEELSIDPKNLLLQKKKTFLENLLNAWHFHAKAQQKKLLTASAPRLKKSA